MPSKVAIIGASGLLGKALTALLLEKGYEVLPVHHQDPLPPADVVINLAGKSISSGLWTKRFKEELYKSRIETTRRLTLTPETTLYIGASSIGYYGDRGEEILTEDSPPGSGFLAELTKDWEEASASFTCRRALLRIAPVLTEKGGFLPSFRKMHSPQFGSGKQGFSWIHIRDFVRAIAYIIENPTMSGPVILAAPESVPQKRLSVSIFHLPAWLLGLLPGNMAAECLLNSTRCYPQKLLNNGFSFLFPTLASALNDLK